MPLAAKLNAAPELKVKVNFKNSPITSIESSARYLRANSLVIKSRAKKIKAVAANLFR